MESVSRYDKGFELLDRYWPEGIRSLQRSLADVAPDLGSYVVEFAYGDIWSREGLDAPRRQLVTLACLTTLGDCDSELRVHTTSALAQDLRPREIVEAVLQCLPYCGFPRVLHAMSIVREVLEHEGRLPVDSASPADSGVERT